MAAKPLILRIETSRGRQRLSFASHKRTLGNLQAAIEEKYNVKPEEQILSKTPPSNPTFIEGSSNDTFTKLGLKHGDLIYLVLGKNHLQNYINKQKQEQNAKQEQLNKNANVAIIDEKEEKKQMSINNNNNRSQQQYQLSERKINKIPNKVTLKSSEWVNDPKHKIVDSGPKHVPFHKWIQDRQKKYSQQPWNIDPPKFNYASIPYKGNVAFKDLPPNAVIKRQEYRHCDVICFKDASPYRLFKTNWEKDSTSQRMAYLIGKYNIEKNTINKNKNKNNSNNLNNKDYSDTLMYGNVYAMYIPPQKGHSRGVQLLKDRNEKSVDLIIKACGLQRIGWTVTTLPRGGKQYHGDIFMSGEEIYSAARLQEKYKNENTGYSRFSTLVVHLGTKEPQAFQISDQGVAVIRYGLVKPDNDPGFLRVSEPPPKVYVPAVINENAAVKPGETFLPDAMLVNVIVTQASQEEHLFHYVKFPPNGGLDHLKFHLEKHKDKEYHVSLSDFNLLCFLPRVIDPKLATTVAEAVASKKRLNGDTVNKLTQAFKNLGLI